MTKSTVITATENCDDITITGAPEESIKGSYANGKCSAVCFSSREVISISVLHIVYIC